MPVLPIKYYSNYYVVEIYFQEFFAALGIPYDLNFSGAVKILASEYKVESNNSAEKKLLVQGKPGFEVQNVEPTTYTYTIKAPLLIRAGGSYFFPYNSLNYFALRMANFQWQQLHGYSTTSISSLDFYVVLEKYTIDVTATEVMQTFVLKSNRPLFKADNPGFWIDGFTIDYLAVNDFNAYVDVLSFIGRTARNYDIYTNMELVQVYDDGTTGSPFFLNSSNSGIFLDSTNFEINFKIENQYFLNSQTNDLGLPLTTFLLKNYDFSHKYGIVGGEGQTHTAWFAGGVFTYYNTINTLAIGNSPYNSNVLLTYQTGMLVKSKSYNLNNNQLFKTDLDFSFYGTTYGPGNSPYGTYDLFYSDIA